MNNGPRIFAYITTVTVIALAVVVLTEHFLTFIDAYGWQKYATFGGYAVVYFNLSISFTRRFIAKAPDGGTIAYILGGIYILPPTVWLFLRDVGMVSNRFQFLAFTLAASMAGAYFGIQLGLKTRTRYRKSGENGKDVPDDLRNAHRKINRN